MKKLALLGVLLLALSGCVEGDRYQFTGSGDNWDVNYVVDVSQQDSEEATGTIRYTGEGTAPETIIYTIASNSSEVSGNVMTTDGTVNIGRSACDGCSIVQRGDDIQVEIKWDGQVETFELSTNN